MTQHTAGVQYLSSPLLTVPHGMFTRFGGCSRPPYDSLNLSHHVGDEDANIRANRRMATAPFAIDILYSAHQVHGSEVVTVPADIETDTEFTGFDALVTDRPGTGLMVQQADCQAILLYAPDRNVIAAIHCGWKGSVSNIIATTIAAMERDYRIDPARLVAVISPSLGPCCAEFIHYRLELPDWMHRFQVRKNHFDFWAISRTQLREAGVRVSRIDTMGICTLCDQRFFSYRRSVKKQKSMTGRNGSIIALPGVTS